MFLIDKNEGKSLLLCPAVATRGFLASASKENPGQQRWAQGSALLPAARSDCSSVSFHSSSSSLANPDVGHANKTQ